MKKFIRVIDAIASAIMAMLFVLVVGSLVGCTNELLEEPNSSNNKDPTKSTGSGSAGSSLINNKVEGSAADDNFILTSTQGQQGTVTLSWRDNNDTYTYLLYGSLTPYCEDGEDTFTEVIPRFRAYDTKEVAQEVYNEATGKWDPVYNEDGTPKMKKERVFTTYITLKVDSGSDVYYKMKSFDKTGALIATSNIARGTSLATPVLSITSRETSSDVQWFMDNCAADTYYKDVMFEVTCYNDKAGTDIKETKVVKGSSEEWKVTFDNLTNGNKYYYKVAAYTKNNPSDTEEAGPLDADTAKSMVPGAVEFTAAKGTDTGAITLDWDAPAFTYVRVKGESVPRPLYFKVERTDITLDSDKYKESSDSATSEDRLTAIESIDSDKWKVIASYIGTQRKYIAGAKGSDKSALQNMQYQFDCAKGVDGAVISIEDGVTYNCFVNDSHNSAATSTVAPAAANSSDLVESGCAIKVTRVGRGDVTQNCDDYKEYVMGAHISFTDTSALRTKKYLYRVTSYTDDYAQVISCDKTLSNSAARVGYLISYPSLTEDCAYTVDSTKGDDDARPIDSWKVTLDFDFNENGVKYNYMLFAQRTPYVDDPSAEGGKGAAGLWKEIVYSENINSFKDALDQYYNTKGVATTDETCGEYLYKIFIMSPTTSKSDVAAYYEELDAHKITFSDASKKVYDIVVTDNPIGIVNNTNALPQLHLFTIEDGFTNKFILTFEYNAKYDYTLQYKSITDGVIADTYNVDKVTIASGAALDANKYKKTDNVPITYKDSEGNSINDTISTITYEASAAAGEGRCYQLLAKSGVTMTKSPISVDTGEVLKKAYTLGVPNVSQQDYHYDEITVKWPAVLKENVTTKKSGDEEVVATGYDIEAYYSDDSSKTNLVKSPKISVKSNKDGDIEYSYTLKKPDGYDDATRAGKEITIKVSVAGSKKVSNVLEKATDTCATALVGPALMDTAIITPEQKKMGLTWNAIAGATGYMIKRVAYSDNTMDKPRFLKNNVDIDDFTYYYDVSAGEGKEALYFLDTVDGLVKIKNSSSDINGDSECCGSCTPATLTSIDGVTKKTYTFINEYKDVNDITDADFELSFNHAVLGLPFKYIVIPVVKTPSLDYPAITLNTLKGETGKYDKADPFAVKAGDVTYKNLKSFNNAMIGCGLDVAASKLDGKADDDDTVDIHNIKVVWQPPYWAYCAASADSATRESVPSSILNICTKSAIVRSKGQAMVIADTTGNKSDIAGDCIYRDLISEETNIEDKVAAYSYAIIYGVEAGDATNTKGIYAAYKDYLDNNTETRYVYGKEDTKDVDGNIIKDSSGNVVASDITAEPKNVGYTFDLKPDCFLLDNQGEEADLDYRMDKTDKTKKSVFYYSEQLGFTTWDLARKLMPNRLSISLKNLNIDNAYHEIATLKYTPGEKYQASGSLKPDDDIKISDIHGNRKYFYVSSQALWDKVCNNSDATKAALIEPSDGRGGATNNSLLRVLRDYKHYYGLKVFAKPRKNCDEIQADEITKDANGNPLATYRNITDEELLKAATLAMTYGMQKSYYKRNDKGGRWSAVKDLEWYTETGIGSGKAGLDSEGGAVKDVWHTLYYQDFIPSLPTKAGVNTTFLKIDCKKGIKGETWDWYAINPPVEYNDYGNHLVVSCADSGISFYDAQIEFHWLNHDANSRDADKGDNQRKGVRVIRDNIAGISFGNITPLPFNEQHDNDFLTDYDEWK